MTSDKTFERFGYQIFELVPQLDRICITSVEGDKLRLKMLQERLGLKTSLKSKSTVMKAKGQALADYAAGDKVIVNQTMANTAGSVMTGMANKDIRSSMHVPVIYMGKPSTINFWSAEPEAFPPEAVKLLEQIAKLMADGAQAVAQK